MSEPRANINEVEIENIIEDSPIFVPSNKGKNEKCYYVGYEYQFERKYKEVIYWKCSK